MTEIETTSAARSPTRSSSRSTSCGLRALDELDADPDRADLGNAIHKALAEFVRRFPRDLPVHAELEAAGDRPACHFARKLPVAWPGAWAFWWPRFERIARWFVAEEAARRPGLADIRSEVEGQLVIPAPGGPFTLRARADRIERLASGALAVIDYKTGALPEKREINAAIAVQLPLEGAIARAGGFGIAAGPIAALEHWKLGGGDPAGKCEPAAQRRSRGADRLGAGRDIRVYRPLRQPGDAVSPGAGSALATALFGLHPSRTP